LIKTMIIFKEIKNYLYKGCTDIVSKEKTSKVQKLRIPISIIMILNKINSFSFLIIK